MTPKKLFSSRANSKSHFHTFPARAMPIEMDFSQFACFDPIVIPPPCILDFCCLGNNGQLIIPAISCRTHQPLWKKFHPRKNSYPPSKQERTTIKWHHKTPLNSSQNPSTSQIRSSDTTLNYYRVPRLRVGAAAIDHLGKDLTRSILFRCLAGTWSR